MPRSREPMCQPRHDDGNPTATSVGLRPRARSVPRTVPEHLSRRTLVPRTVPNTWHAEHLFQGHPANTRHAEHLLQRILEPFDSEAFFARDTWNWRALPRAVHFLEHKRENGTCGLKVRVHTRARRRCKMDERKGSPARIRSPRRDLKLLGADTHSRRPWTEMQQ